MKKSLYLALFLAWICVLSGGLLALANDVTAPIIEKNNAQAEAASFDALFGAGTQYTAVEFDNAAYPHIEKVFKAGADNYAYKATIYGFQSDITFIVGIDSNGNIMGFATLSINDTPGFGARVGTQEYVDLVMGSDITKNVDTLAGATVSSSAVQSALAEIGQHYANEVK